MRLPQDLRGISVERLVTWVALGTVSVFLVWSAIRIRDITLPIYQNSDIASAPVMAQYLPDHGSGSVTLGYYPWLESLFALDLTRWVPSHVSFWKAAPFVVYGLTVAMVGWTVMRVSSWRAGLLVALAMAAPAPTVIYMLGAPNQRLPVLAHTVLLAAFLVTVTSLAGWGRVKQAVWALALAVSLAPGVASDPLLVLSAVLPFLAAIGLGWWRRLLPRGLAAVAAGACVAGAIGGWGLEHLAEHFRIVYNENPFELAGSGRVLSNAGLLLEDVALFAHGKFATAGMSIDWFNAVRELIAIGAIVAVILFAWHAIRSAPVAMIDGARSVEGRLLGTYWIVSIVAVSLAFLIITAPVGTNSVRYVTTLWPALLTLGALLYGSRAQTGLALLAAGAALVGCLELGRGFYTPGTGAPPDTAEVQAVEYFVSANRLDHGYAGYWEAAPISLQSNFTAPTYPIEPCLLPEPGHYCPFSLHTIQSWYSPKSGVRTFYVTNDQRLEPDLNPPPSSWGRPFKTARFGDLTVYAFDYDIASQFDPTKPGESPPGSR